MVVSSYLIPVRTESTVIHALRIQKLGTIRRAVTECRTAGLVRRCHKQIFPLGTLHAIARQAPSSCLMVALSPLKTAAFLGFHNYQLIETLAVVIKTLSECDHI